MGYRRLYVDFGSVANDRFGSLAVVQPEFSPMSGFGRTADVLELALRSSPSNCALHKAGCFIPLLLSFQLSFFLWTMLSLFLLFLFAFIFLSLIAHIGFSVIENAFLALQFFLLKQSTPRPLSLQEHSPRWLFC